VALLTLAEHKTWAGITTTDSTRDAALQEMIDEAIDAVKSYCNNGELEATEYTQILDSPPTTAIILPYTPVVIDSEDSESFQLWKNDSANGDPSLFTDEFLLEMYLDYVLDIGPANITTSDTGIVRFMNRAVGVNYERPLYSLGLKIVPIRKSIKVVYTAGYETIPPRLQAALNLIVRKLYNMRKLGIPMNSESLNGYSYSGQGAATANGIVGGDPTVQQMLRSFCRPQIGGYY
jgi:hypothetical protein